MGMKVKIIDVPVKEQVRDSKFFENIDAILEGAYQTMLNEFRQVKTRIAGITCYTPEYSEVVKLAMGIKKIDSSVTVITGGVHPTLLAEDFFAENTGVDICVVGEGEVTLYELVRRILYEPEKGIGDIEGVVFKDSVTNTIRRTPLRPIEEDLDKISFPDYSLIDMGYYTNASPYSIRGCYLRSVYLLATRGCPSQCTFCVAKKLRSASGKGKFVRIRSARNIVDELKGLRQKYRIDAFYFVDDLFTIDKENVKEFCRTLKNEGLDLLWGCSSKVSTVDEEVLKAMSEAGCIQIDFGVERGSDRALELIKKGITTKKVVEVFDLCHKYGMRTFANMLVNLPGETERDLDDILNLLSRIKAEAVFLNIFLAFPGTEIYENSKHKLKREEYPLLSKDLGYLLKNQQEKFKFAGHNVELDKWSSENYKKYNSVLRNFAFYLSPRYWKVLFKSRAKMNYVRQFGLLVREFINQKINDQY